VNEIYISHFQVLLVVDPKKTGIKQHRFLSLGAWGCFVGDDLKNTRKTVESSDGSPQVAVRLLCQLLAGWWFQT